MLKRWAPFALGLLILLALVLVTRRHLTGLERLLAADVSAVAAMGGVFLLLRWFDGEAWRLLLRPLGCPLRRGETFLLTMARTYAGLLVPRAGLGLPALYLRARCGLGFAEYGSLLLPLALLHAVAVGALGLAGQGLVYLLEGRRPEPLLAAVFAAVLVAGAAAALLPLPGGERLRRWGSLGCFLGRLREAWYDLRRRPGLLRRLLVLQILIMAAQGLQLYLAFRALGVAASPGGVLVAAQLGAVLFMLSVTPNGLGFREAAIVYAAEAANATPAVALAAALLDRLVMTAVVIAVAQIGLWRLGRPLLERGAAARRGEEPPS